MTITWIGHSCFKVENDGYVVIFDPTEDNYVPGITPVREKAHLTICSHDHGDHNARQLIETIADTPCPYEIKTISTFHDDKNGSLRGNNTITILNDGKYRIAHFGDLGCNLTREEIELLKGVSVAFIPVGGYYTIDGTTAAKIIKEIEPDIAIPMHFRDDVLGFGFDVISTVDEFVNAMGQGEYTEKSSMEFEKTDGTKVVILKPTNLK